MRLSPPSSNLSLNCLKVVLPLLGLAVLLRSPEPALLLNAEFRSESSKQDLVYNPAVQPLSVTIHLRQRQATLYQGAVPVKTYAIGVGRPGWETPTGRFQVTQKLSDPTWISPFNGQVIPGGDPRNPMGHHWIGFWSDGRNQIGFHGTLDNRTIGQAASHGCIHMTRQDLSDLFARVQVGTPIMVEP